MSKLIEIFKKLPVPELEKGAEFSAAPIRGNGNHRIGKDVNGCPTLLISIKDSDSDKLLPNIKLKNIRVMYDQECRIRYENKVEEGIFTILTFTGSDTSLYDSFLRFCDILLDSIKKNPDRESVAKILDRCVKLFKDITNPPLKSIHGLWAELFFMTLAKDKVKIIKSWHINPEDKWDFTLGKIRYEIKSSSNRKRQHFFSHEQLRALSNAELFIVSIFTERTGTGKSIGDLVEELKKLLANHVDLVEKIYTICYKILGNSLDDSFKLKFDMQLAKSSIKAYHLDSIPKIPSESIPPQISDLKYKIDLEGVETDDQILSDLLD